MREYLKEEYVRKSKSAIKQSKWLYRRSKYSNSEVVMIIYFSTVIVLTMGAIICVQNNDMVQYGEITGYDSRTEILYYGQGQIGYISENILKDAEVGSVCKIEKRAGRIYNLEC